MTEETSAPNPLLAALPPATDYLTYLTLIEYNLTAENLPVLHQVLQDTELTSNIGWDLIHLLLPLLPASQDCLRDIAIRGNPRECILKVTEALRLLEFDEHNTDSDEEETQKPTDSSIKTSVHEESLTATNIDVTPPLPLHVLKYESLLSLLATLHRRIKTKYPSRFLSTSLQAVLAAYDNSTKHRDALTISAVKFVKELSGTKRPHLPPRTSSGNLLRSGTSLSEPDPEAHNEPPTADESTLSTRLLQSFLTHVLEDYVLSLSSDQDVPGLSWSSRLMEKFEPHRTVPNRTTYADRFATEEDLKTRSAIVGQLVALAQDLGISTSELVRVIYDPEVEGLGKPTEEDEPPSSASDIPLSKVGSLLLFVARNVKQVLYATTGNNEDISIAIFPDHANLLEIFVGTNGQQTIGLEAEVLLDAILSLGLIALQNNNVGEPADDEKFAKYLQATSLIAANTPSPTLRYHAHYLTSTILRSHPSDIVRLSFIRDTLEHCPYENLKASAVGWLKGETLEANIAQPNSPTESPPSIFGTGVALQSVSAFLFPDLTQSWPTSVAISESWMDFRMELSFYLATLNFFYLLLTATMLHENLDIAGLHKEGRVEQHYLAPLKETTTRFKQALEEGGELAIAEGEEGVDTAKADIARLEDVLERVEKGLEKLKTSA